jgi:hypothetical protein
MELKNEISAPGNEHCETDVFPVVPFSRSHTAVVTLFADIFESMSVSSIKAN